MDPYLFKRLWRRPWLSICSLVLSCVLCFLLCFLSGYLESQQAELARTKESFDILCVVSNRQGTQTRSLRMGSSAIYFVTGEDSALPKHIRDVRMTKEFLATVPALGLQDVELLAITGETCVDVLNPVMGGGAVYDTEDFYSRTDYVCLVSEENYNALTEKTVTVTVTDLYAHNTFSSPDEGIGTVEIRVAGYYPGKGNSIYMPFDAAMELALEISGRWSCDSIAFLAADNEKLDELSRIAGTLFGTVDPLASENSNPRVALTIHDEQYRATIAALEQNIRRTQYLLPLISLLALLLGFFISFLATRGENRTYALMRTLGMTQGKLAVSIFREQILIPLLSGAVLAILTGNPGSSAFYLVCYVIGCGVATIRVIRQPLTTILREQE